MITKLAPTPRTRHMQTPLRLLNHIPTPRALLPLLRLRQPQHPLRILVLRADLARVFPGLTVQARALFAFRARANIAFDLGRWDEGATRLGRAVHGVRRVHFEKHQIVLLDEGRVESGQRLGTDVAAASKAGFGLERGFEARCSGISDE